MRTLVKSEIALAATSFVAVFLVGAAREAAIRMGAAAGSADLAAKAIMLLFFSVFAIACAGLLFHLFIVLQIAIGNGGSSAIRFMSSHETGITVAIWGFLAAGTLVAIPAVLYDMGVRMPLRSAGVLSANIGMTIDEVKARSTLQFPEPRLMGDGSHMGVEKMVFDFEIAGSAVHFPQSRYYWLQTPKNDRHITVLNIGITPQKLPASDLDAFQHACQTKLFSDGWMPGHYVATTEETIRLWSGQRTAGDGRYWRKGNTLLIFERTRMDEAKSGEPSGSGEYVIDLHLRPNDYDTKLVFEPSAWPAGKR